jgi:hypothetical protein
VLVFKNITRIDFIRNNLSFLFGERFFPGFDNAFFLGCCMGVLTGLVYVLLPERKKAKP